MSDLGIDNFFKTGEDILSSEKDASSNTILITTGDCVSGSVSASGTEWWQQVGFASRPSNISDKQDCAQAIVLSTSGRDVAIASRDVRAHAIYGNLRPGEVCIYATGTTGTAQGRILLKDDGSINLYTRQGNTSSGNGMALIMSASDNSISMVNGNGYGIIVNADGVTITAGSASLTLGSNGAIKLIGTGATQIDGTSIILGSNPIMTLATNAALHGPTGVSGLPSLKVMIE